MQQIIVLITYVRVKEYKYVIEGWGKKGNFSLCQKLCKQHWKRWQI
jgi:hypothetical protein